jgi:hypothetical protein
MRYLGPVLLLLGGCDLFGTVRPSGKPVSEAYGGSHELRVLDIESPLRAEKKLPILSTPEVFAVYVPSHAERDIMIGEHWLFLKLRDSEWLVDRLNDPDPPTTGEAARESLRPLKELDWNRVVVPHHK